MKHVQFSESTLIQILDVLPDGILWVTPQQNENGEECTTSYCIRYINASARRLLPISEENIVGQSLHGNEFIDDINFQHLLSEVSTPSNIFYSEYSQKWLHIDKQQVIEGYVIRISDVTHHKKQQERIERLAEKLQRAIDTSQAGTFYTSPVYNENGEIIDWIFNTANQTIASFVNLQPEDLIGERGSKWFPAYMTNGMFDKYVETFTTGRTIRWDLHYYEEGKIDVWADLMITKVDNELLITLTDFTTIKKLQLQLEGYVYELKRSNESLEQFAYAASHDLQAPLRKISINIEKLEQHYANVLDDKGYSYIERIKTVTKRMRTLIQDLLIFAEVGAAHADLELVDLNQIVQEVVNDLEVAIEERSGRIQIGQLGCIRGNSIHLQQLFQNLISNSLKYSKVDVPPYISITAETVKTVPAELSSNLQNSNNHHLLIKVQDNGQGFSNEQAKQIFKIFQRLPQHQNEYSGTGIGLAIVQRVVENHKGYILAEGVPGEGAVFKVYLPFV